MKKLLLVTLVSLLAIALYGQGISFKASESGISVNISGMEESQTTQTTATSSEEIVDKIAEKLEVLQNKYLVKLNKLQQRKSTQLLDDIYDLLALIPDDVTITVTSTTEEVVETPTQQTSFTVNINDNTNNSTPSTSTTTVVATKKNISSSDFSKLLQRIKNESFAEDQLRVVKMAVKSHYFSCTQIIKVLNQFTFADDKLDALGLIYPRVTNEADNYMILDTFTFSDDKDSAEQIMQ